MESAIKISNKIALTVIIAIITMMVFQPVFMSTTNTESEKGNTQSINQQGISNEHGKFVLYVNISTCPSAPCGGWW